MLPPLPRLLLEPLARSALLEDLGRAGDITTDALIPPEAAAEAVLAAREAGVVSGLELARLAFALMDPAIAFEALLGDGEAVPAGGAVARVRGPARGILGAERVALNFLCHLSGIATATAGLVEAIRGHKARVVCTRKTTPGLRAVEKHAVRAGGGANHRFGLDDAVLIKDNHIALTGGLKPAVARARARVGHLVRIEVEVDGLGQLAEALEIGVDAVLLDNMTPAVLAEAVRMAAGRAVTEASGRITPATAPAPTN